MVGILGTVVLAYWQHVLLVMVVQDVLLADQELMTPLLELELMLVRAVQ